MIEEVRVCGGAYWILGVCSFWRVRVDRFLTFTLEASIAASIKGDDDSMKPALWEDLFYSFVVEKIPWGRIESRSGLRLTKVEEIPRNQVALD